MLQLQVVASHAITMQLQVCLLSVPFLLGSGRPLRPQVDVSSYW